MVRLSLSSLFVASSLLTAYGGTVNVLPRAPVEKFDYVIVGGGTAGLVVANRLSANPNLQVAVIEAGTIYEVSNPLLSSTPAGDVIGCGSSESPNPAVDWGFITQAMPGTNGRTVRYARGKCLGGTSARNFMIYQRPTRFRSLFVRGQVTLEAFRFGPFWLICR